MEAGLGVAPPADRAAALDIAQRSILERDADGKFPVIDEARNRAGAVGQPRSRARPGLADVLGCLALITATVNCVGGFLVTNRMLKMFSDRKK